MVSIEKKIRIGGWSHNKFRQMRHRINNFLDNDERDFDSAYKLKLKRWGRKYSKLNIVQSTTPNK
jgi:hypothetical protein